MFGVGTYPPKSEHRRPNISMRYNPEWDCLIEGAQWMEDFGVFWLVTVKN